MLPNLPLRTRLGWVSRVFVISTGIAAAGVSQIARAEASLDWPTAPAPGIIAFDESEPKLVVDEPALPTSAARVSVEPSRDTFDGARFGEQLSFGLSFRDFDYREELAVPFKSTERGFMPAMHAGYFRESGLGPFFVEADAAFGGGSLQYDGSTQKGQTASGVSPSTVADAGARAGVRLWSHADRVASRGRLYAGLAYHYWSRGDGGVLPGTQIVSVREIYQRLYAPIGVRIENDLAPRLSLAADASLRPAVAGRMTMEFSRSYSGGQDTTVGLGNRLGWRAELPLAWRATPDLVLTFAPWYESSSIGTSEHVTTQVSARRRETVWEPSSATSELGTALDVTVRI